MSRGAPSPRAVPDTLQELAGRDPAVSAKACSTSAARTLWWLKGLLIMGSFLNERA
jgi:hypothetical protein